MAYERFVGILIAGAVLAASFADLKAQTPPATTPGSQATPQTPTDQPPVFTTSVTVIESAPLPGVDLPLEKIPSPVQTATAQDIERTNALDLSAFLMRRFNGVFANEIQSNPFQPDINYRGYTASPLLGTPQGLSVYMDGVRLNQPFGCIRRTAMRLILKVGSIILTTDSISRICFTSLK